MTVLPAYGRVLTVRPEVLEDDLVSMVNLAALRDDAPSGGLAAMVPKGPLVDPAAFFEITYPTEDTKAVLGALAERANNPGATAGTILLSGSFGLGKSHLMLAAHHALTTPEAVAAWAKRHGIAGLSFPAGSTVITRSYIDRSDAFLWTGFLEGVGRQDLEASITTHLDGEQIREALGDKRVFLIFDELERWFASLDSGARSRNLNFIQALTEVAASDPRLTLLTSVLGETAEPAETIRRIKPLELKFRSATDRERIILFRLFENRDQADDGAIAGVVDAYVAAYQKAGLGELDTYRERMRETYPFTPEFLDILTKKVPNLGGFQATRGTLRFLARVVAATADRRPLVSSQDIPIRESSVETDLKNLDRADGELVRRALGDNWDAVPNDVHHKASLFSALVFYSIADPARPGASDDDLLRAVVDPGENANHLRDDLNRVRELAYNLHVEDGRLLFKARENPQARINAVARSPKVTDDACTEIALRTLVETWGERARTAVFNGDVEATSRELQSIRSRPKFLLSTRSLDAEVRLRHQLQSLDERRNLVLLIEPRTKKSKSDGTFNITRDDDVRAACRRIEACNILLEGAPAADAAAIYHDVRRHEETSLKARIRDAYGVYIRWRETGSTQTTDIDPNWCEPNAIDEFSARAFMDSFRKQHSNPVVVAHHLRSLWRKYLNRPVRQLIDHFEKKPGEPVPFDESFVPGAVRQLVGKRVFGLEDPNGNPHDHVDGVSDAALAEFVVIETPVVVEPPTPERLAVHEFVTASYDARLHRVRIEWETPDTGRTYRTLVKRHTSHRNWRPGEAVKLGFDETRDDQRYFGQDKECIDPEGNASPLQKGARYHYYVFLVDETGSEPVAVLSQRCDISIPSDDTTVEPGTINIGWQSGRDALFQAIEVALLTGGMKTDSTARRVEFAIESIESMDPLLVQDHRAGVRFSAAKEASCHGTLTYVVRGRWKRDAVLGLVTSLPDVPGAVYRATIAKSDGDSDEENDDG